LRRVVGDSMKPTYRNGQTVLVSLVRNFKVGDVVVAVNGNREVLKRITKIDYGKVFLEGDNKDNSTDSRDYGWLPETRIQAKVIWPRKDVGDK
jgi:phage repressor protein C with HTH and peptisase S24 domain